MLSPVRTGSHRASFTTVAASSAATGTASRTGSSAWTLFSLATAAIARGEATRTKKADNNKFVNSLSIHNDNIQGSDVLDLREIHVVLKLPAAASDPASDAPDEQEPDPEGGDEQEPEGDEQELTEEETVDFNKFVQENKQQADSFAEFVQYQKVKEAREAQEEAEHFFQLMSNLQVGNNQQTTARARGQAAMGSGGSSSSGSAAMAAASSFSVAWRPAWHGLPVTQSQRDLLKKLCQEMPLEEMI